MFIYKITVIPIDKVYIGMDTKPSYKLKRWNEHCRYYKKNNTKLYKAMTYYGIDQCSIEVLEDNFQSITDLAVAEINYIKKYDSYRNGLNSTPGGDGLGHHLETLDEKDIEKIKESLGENFRNYNKNIKWTNTSNEDRKNLTAHLHTEEVYQKKSSTLKKFYEINPLIKKEKGIAIKEWQEKNYKKLKENNRINGKKGAEKVSKKLEVETEDGSMLYFASKSEFQRQTGQWANTVLEKSKNGEFHNGYKAKEI
jgi:hypothetical protein